MEDQGQAPRQTLASNNSTSRKELAGGTKETTIGLEQVSGQKEITGGVHCILPIDRRDAHRSEIKNPDQASSLWKVTDRLGRGTMLSCQRSAKAKRFLVFFLTNWRRRYFFAQLRHVCGRDGTSEGLCRTSGQRCHVQDRIWRTHHWQWRRSHPWSSRAWTKKQNSWHIRSRTRDFCIDLEASTHWNMSVLRLICKKKRMIWKDSHKTNQSSDDSFERR